MKAITISQPYASMIARGEKWVENRHWGTKYRGPIAIHAGKGTQYLDREDLVEQGLPTGCVVAVAVLVACMPIASMRRFSPATLLPLVAESIGEILAHEHTEGPWCWIFARVRRLDPPIPCSGKQGLWDWNERETEVQKPKI